jgi:hypothetical protein
MPRFGFIHEKLDIKILILFILRRLPGTVDAATLCDLVNCDDGIDYFDYTDCLADLVKTGHIEESDDGYSITDKGVKNAESVESSLPYSVRTKAERNLAPVARRLQRMAMLTAKHETENGVCMLTVGMSDGKGEIFSARLLVPDEDAAKKMEKNFRLHAEEIYGRMIDVISGEKEKKQ